MTFKPVKTTCFIKYLEHLGLTKVRETASHSSWSKSGLLRPVVIRIADKDIPPIHLKTNCQTLKVSMNDMYKWIRENC